MLENSSKTDDVPSVLAGSFERIILTGFRGTGKSVVGRHLAGLMGCRFADTDTILADDMQCSVSEFVNSRGWDAFRKRERFLLQRLARETDMVIATGGGAVQHRDEWDKLRKNSLVVWLQADAETIRQRLLTDSRTRTNRPSLTDEGALDEVSGLLVERDPLYRQGSDIRFDTTKMSPEKIASLIQGKYITRRTD